MLLAVLLSLYDKPQLWRLWFSASSLFSAFHPLSSYYHWVTNHSKTGWLKTTTVGLLSLTMSVVRFLGRVQRAVLAFNLIWLQSIGGGSRNSETAGGGLGIPPCCLRASPVGIPCIEVASGQLKFLHGFSGPLTQAFQKETERGLMASDHASVISATYY